MDKYIHLLLENLGHNSRLLDRSRSVGSMDGGREFGHCFFAPALSRFMHLLFETTMIGPVLLHYSKGLICWAYACSGPTSPSCLSMGTLGKSPKGD